MEHGRFTAQARSSGIALEAVRVWLLGDFRVSVGSRSVEENRWRLRKAGSLLKLLALAQGHRLHREQIMAALWPELDAEAAANNLHHALHVARRTLEPSAPASAASGCLGLRDEQLVLCSEGQLWVDVEAFEEAAATAHHTLEPAAYEAAIDLYAGELLPRDRYEPWVEEKRAELRGIYLSLLVDLAGLYEQRGEIGEAIEALSKVVAREPTHEEAHVGLMRLYALLGRRREALGQYERLSEAFLRQFRAEPGEVASRLQEEIWAGTFPPADSPPPAGLEPEEPTEGGKHNLPLARTSFVGRERETLEVKRLLAMTRLLSLTGPPGCGKTRLALKVAQDLAGAYPEGAWLVELAPLSEAELAPQAVARALGVREQPNQALVETLKDTLRPRKMLLVLDNCEHLLGAVVGLVDALLDCCPGLRVLATSRETLDAAGEVNRVVPPLTVPGSGQPSAPEEIDAYESVRLFVERARQRDPSFVLTLRNASAVAQVCRRLEGIPLAIELGAARMGVLSAEQLASRLEDSLKLLARGSLTSEPRHRTLGATLDWSHELLCEDERALFGRLSVFAGGWTLEAAEEVCSGEGIEREEVLELLSELVDKSLVVAEASSPGEEGVPRFRMLEPVRQYGRERLEAAAGTAARPEAERVRERHARYFLTFAEGEDGAERIVYEGRPVEWHERMKGEHANLRAALSWSLGKDTEPDVGRAAEHQRLGLRLAVALFWFWQAHQSEGRRYLEWAASATRSDPTATRWRARALHGAAWITGFEGDFGAAKLLMEESVVLYREAGDEEGIASGLTTLGIAAVLGQRDDVPIATVLEELGKRKPKVKNRSTLGYLLILEGLVALSRGDLERSATLHEESLELLRGIGDALGVMTCKFHLAGIALLRGDHERAAPLLREALRWSRETDNKAYIQLNLHWLGCVAAGRERPVRAARLWGAVEGMRDEYGVHISPAGLSFSSYEGHLAAARSQLDDEEAFAAAWAEGKAMPMERAIEYALSEEEGSQSTASSPRQPEVGKAAPELTRREQEIALRIARGLTNRRISSELAISERTVENHVRRMLKKLGFRSRAQIAAWVAQQ